MLRYYILMMMVLGFICQAIFIYVEHEQKYVLADILKGLASFCFVVIGVMGCKLYPESSKLIMYGLIFGLIGDVLLNLRFVFKKNGQKAFLLGILAFLIGHILYLIALISKTSSKDLFIPIIIGLVIAIALLIYIFKTMEVKLPFKIFGVFYLSAVIVMTCLAISSAINYQSVKTISYAIGAVLFTISDIVLIFNTFSGTTKFSLRITNLTLYYIGQMLIALSLLFN